MKPTLKVFMNKIIDYAGLFPPSNLSMNDAIQNYLNYLSNQDEWMLSRFICSASKLPELDKYKDDFYSLKKEFQISLLGRGGKNSDDFFKGLDEDIQFAKKFKEVHGDKVLIDAYEVRFPESVIEESNPVRITEFLNKVAEIIESHQLDKIRSFYEGAFWGDWRKSIDALVEGISYHNVYVQSKKFNKYQIAGYKMRCGGIDPSMYPTPEQIAAVIQTCKRRQIALKATAGLHHPLRHFNKDEQVKMHGFLNLFGAGILTQYHDLGLDRLQSIIEDEKAINFVFTDYNFRWSEFSVTADQIQKAREQNIISFGSCSFDEPREDLQKLGYL